MTGGDQTGNFSRRRMLLLAGTFGVGGLAAACGSGPAVPRPVQSAAPAPAALVAADYAGVPDGPVPPIGMRPWFLSSSRENPVILRQALGPPAGHVPGDGPGGTAAGYAQIELPGPCRRVGGSIRWDAAVGGDSTVSLGAFSTIGFNTVLSSSPIHLAVTPTGCELSVFAGGYDDYTSLVPAEGSGTFQTFDEPLNCDGASTYRCECVVDPVAGTATVSVGDRFTGSYRDPRLIDIPASYAFWEYYTQRGETTVGRFTSIWADLR